MKRLLAEGWEKIFQICKVFRNGEITDLHNPEFTMLEFYRAHADYHSIMEDTEQLIVRGATAILQSYHIKVGQKRVSLEYPFERLSVRDAFLSRTGIDLSLHLTANSLRSIAQDKGFSFSPSSQSFEDYFFQIFLTAVEPTLGWDRPTFLMDYPACMASLARLKPSDSTLAERVELYIAGVELANGFSELNEEKEQRRRLVEEQQYRKTMNKPVYPLDEHFLQSVGKMPPATGIAIGLDRLLMLLLDVNKIDQILLFPTRRFAEPTS
jgi:lysyl-tRNA synthetase class 2